MASQAVQAKVDMQRPAKVDPDTGDRQTVRSTAMPVFPRCFNVKLLGGAEESGIRDQIINDASVPATASVLSRESVEAL